MRHILTAGALLLCCSGMAEAQTATSSASAATPVDSARLAAAQQLLTVMMPPAQRAQMIENMVRPMMANVRQSLVQAPGFAKLFGDNAEVAGKFDRFMKAQQERSLATLAEALPEMIDAMARAYARNFDVQQLGEIRAFYQTPTGQALIAKTAAVMSDPDVLAWQRDRIGRSMANMQEDLAKFVKELSASQPSENQ